MRQVAFVAGSDWADLTPDEHSLFDPLRSAGIAVSAAVWDDPAVRWQDFDGIIIRATWDYHRKYDSFRGWLTEIERIGLPIWNPARLVAWNTDKSYLLDLQQAGIHVAPSLLCRARTQMQLGEAMHERGWTEAIFKPLISAGGYNTYRVALENADLHQARFQALLNERDLILQPFIREILTEGEWSLMFFNKRYSHTVIKRPTGDEFRVQQEHGGSTDAIVPPSHLVAQAQQIVNHIRDPLLYARVDGVQVGGKLMLMELELVEPFLFLGYDPDAPERFAAAIAEVIRPRSQ